MHSDWFNGIDILQGRWQNGGQVGYCYPSGLEKTLCKWEIYVPLVTKGLKVPGSIFGSDPRAQINLATALLRNFKQNIRIMPYSRPRLLPFQFKFIIHKPLCPRR
jgi:hypothetical protein